MLGAAFSSCFMLCQTTSNCFPPLPSSQESKWLDDFWLLCQQFPFLFDRLPYLSDFVTVSCVSPKCLIPLPSKTAGYFVFYWGCVFGILLETWGLNRYSVAQNGRKFHVFVKPLQCIFLSIVSDLWVIASIFHLLKAQCCRSTVLPAHRFSSFELVGTQLLWSQWKLLLWNMSLWRFYERKSLSYICLEGSDFCCWISWVMNLEMLTYKTKFTLLLCYYIS